VRAVLQKNITLKQETVDEDLHPEIYGRNHFRRKLSSSKVKKTQSKKLDIKNLGCHMLLNLTQPNLTSDLA